MHAEGGNGGPVAPGDGSSGDGLVERRSRGRPTRAVSVSVEYRRCTDGEKEKLNQAVRDLITSLVRTLPNGLFEEESK